MLQNIGYERILFCYKAKGWPTTLRFFSITNRIYQSKNSLCNEPCTNIVVVVTRQITKTKNLKTFKHRIFFHLIICFINDNRFEIYSKKDSWVVFLCRINLVHLSIIMKSKRFQFFLLFNCKMLIKKAEGSMTKLQKTCQFVYLRHCRFKITKSRD